MKIIIVYDTVSAGRNTEKIANAFSAALQEKGFDVATTLAGDVDKTSLKNFDCVLVGSPTMGWGGTKPVKELLESFSINEYSGKLAVAFDTRIESRLSGSATKGIEERLKKIGFKIASKPFFAYVERDRTTKDYILKEGQIEKAKAYALELAKTLTG